MNRQNIILITGFLLLILLWSCNNDKESGFELDIITDLQINTNPNGVAPLTAILNITTDQSASVRLRVIGQHGSASDVVQDFPDFGVAFEIPVLGLYSDYENQIELTFFDKDGVKLGTQNLTILTEALIPDMPIVEIDVSNSNSIKPGFNFVNYFGHNGDYTPQRPFMFDAFGDIRWYLNYAADSTFILADLFFDNGMNRLQNGNLIFGDGTTETLYEINMLGEIINSWPLDGYGFHHHIIEKPNGDFLVTVNDLSKTTEEDVILEIDRNSGSILNKWDLNLSLDNARRAWETQRADMDIDWFHANGLEYSESDNTIIVSGRTQCLVKLTEANEVVWILAPHKDWETAGSGTDLKQFLLQPLDNQGLFIEDQQVLDGETNHPDFEWAWYQHSPILLPNGNLMVFDNGDNRNYTGAERYSRVVEYQIDEVNKTIQQKWSYGKDRGPETYSAIVSKVLYFEEEKNVLFTPGAIAHGGGYYGKVIELDRQSGQVLFEATIRPPETLYGITFHNVQRMELYQ